jgi:serine/threonine protein kinase
LDRGRVIGEKYELVSPIGEGGMGVVWRARHVTLGREVALKRVLGDHASETTLQRFLREAQSAAAVRAPNVVDVVDYGRDAGGDPYLVMELLDGESLEQRLRREPPLGLDEVLDLLDQALAGLTAIHDASIVHRDLKPANLFLAKVPGADRVVVKVLDFGIARPAAPDASALTHTMQTLGTPHYMSPEQVRSAKNVDARSDVYAMGVIFYQVVTGRLPFEGPSATAIIAAIVTEDPPAIRSLRPEVPALVAEVIQRAMSRRAEDRFADARALREAISKARAGETIPGLDIGRVSVNAPTVVMDSAGHTPRPEPRTPAPISRPEPRTGRRGFFALFGMLGTAAAAGLAFLATQRSASAPSADTAPAPPMAAPVPAGSAVSRSRQGLGGGGASGGGGGAIGVLDESGATSTGAPAVAPIEPTIPMIVGEPAPLATLALRWRSLEPADRVGLVVRPLDDGWVLTTASPGLAQRVAAALGASAHEEASPAPAGAMLTPRLFRTNARSNVRRAPTQDAGLIATVMDEAVLVGLVGNVEDQPSGNEETEGWVRVFASSSLDGWTARRLLEEDSRCAPRADAFASSETIARATLHEGPREYDAFVAIDARSARVFETDSMCNLLERHVIRTPGAIADAFVTELSNHGESVLVLAEWPSGRIAADGRQSWTARLLSDPDRVIWDMRLASGQNLPDARRDGLGGPFSRGPDGAETFFPLRIRHPRERVWLLWNEEHRTFEPLAQPSPQTAVPDIASEEE